MFQEERFLFSEKFCIEHFDCFVLCYELLSNFLRTAYRVSECNYHVLLFECVLLCIAETKCVVIKEGCKVIFLFFPFISYSAPRR